MNDLKHYITAIKAFIALLMVSLFFTGNFVFFILVYLLVFLFMAIRTFVVPAERKIKIYLIIVYAAITIVQLSFNSLVTFTTHDSIFEFYLSKLFSVIIILFPFVIERFVTINKYAKFYLPSTQELSTITFAEIKKNKDKIIEMVGTLNKAGKSFSSDNLKEIINDLPRHNSFQYISKGSLTEEYFELAYANLRDPYIYIIISNTGSAASEIISVFTQKQYNHASLSFDYDLKTLISYNGGERVYSPGLNHEMIEFFNKKDDASIIVYKLKSSEKQKKMIIDKLREINRDGSAYNMAGLVFKYSHKPNILFCSQFVYKMLKFAGLAYFDKKDGQVKPTDLVELDYYRKLQFAYEIHLNKNAEDFR